MIHEDKIIEKAKDYIKHNYNEEEAIIKAIKDYLSKDELRGLYSMFDVTEYDLMTIIQMKLNK